MGKLQVMKLYMHLGLGPLSVSGRCP